MKKVILSAVLIAVVGFTSCKNNTQKNAKETTEMAKTAAITNLSFGVRGNCKTCKKAIEKAVNNVDGVTHADWNVDKKNITVSFDANKTNETAIHNAIAAAGYDTEKVAGSSEAYNNLPKCCQYDHEMTMNQ
ncbi:heavy-metal-associated domain-containing protein [Tenacibaculum sp. UWU-22]|uniref:heavy-metal-associated domain-containing protein n=1 Tax=Tenacibaculum sp. UWU-22 TaxID=3234187 RepID=UPI0034DB78CE